MKEITIIGAGLVGSLLSIYLSKKGYKVKVYERSADMRKEKVTAGRSINLALSDRGIKALEEVGIMDEIRKICIPMHGRFIHHTDGGTSFQAYGMETWQPFAFSSLGVITSIIFSPNCLLWSSIINNK